MTKLSAEAYAIIEGRHTDPFRYLGLHAEGDRNIVRAFLPEARNVEAIGEHGERATLEQIHEVRAVRRPAAERLDADINSGPASATMSSNWTTPIAFRRS